MQVQIDAIRNTMKLEESYKDISNGTLTSSFISECELNFKHVEDIYVTMAFRPLILQ